MFLGIDVGTSSVKAVIVDGDGTVIAESTTPLTVDRPHPLWSEQNPESWWIAADAAVLALPAASRAAVRAVGLSGQMHGAVLLDAADQVLRPAILWNDGRSGAECIELERDCPALRTISGNAAMAGFTAPKLLWVRKHEPAIFTAIGRVLLPKDYVRLRMTGDHATDLSDASGTLWLDVGHRSWSAELLAAAGLDERHMPTLYEGNAATGQLRAAVAGRWGMERVPVAAGGGDNAAGAIGAGVISVNQAFLSLGTSGVLFAASDVFSPAPERGAHAFCHALPGRWHQMAVILSAAASIDWIGKLTGAASAAEAIEEAASAEPFVGREIFLPYLSGERTPHNDPHATGSFTGLTYDSDRPALVRAVLEGVALALADGFAVLTEAGAAIEAFTVLGGGSRSRYWGKVIAAALDRPLIYRQDAHVGPAYGAARLARLAVTGEPSAAVCVPQAIAHVIDPEPTLVARAADRLSRFRELYRR